MNAIPVHAPRRRALALSLCACGLYTGSLPPFEIWWLAPVALFPVALFLLDPNSIPKWTTVIPAALLFGEFTTLAVGGHWLYAAAHGFFDRSITFSVLFTLATTITHAGIFIAAAVICSARLGRLGARARILVFACIWVAWEYIRANILYGCPWDFLGHAFSPTPALMQLSGLGGAYILSWLCAVTAGAFAVAMIERSRPSTALGALGLALVATVSAFAYGHWTMTAIQTSGNRPLQPLSVGLVQANVGRHELWKPEFSRRHLNRLLELSRSPSMHGADLIVWAENSVPFLLDADADARRAIHELVRDTGAALLVGAPSSRATQDGSAQFFNSMYLFTPEAEGYRTYDKRKLLPYVEATPAWAVHALGRPSGIEYSNGRKPVLFEVKGWKISPLICFESTYPELARDAASVGADLLVNVSNDSWFDQGSAPQQHFAMTKFRATENGLPIVRVANTGVSGVIDASGHTTMTLPEKSEQVGLATVFAPARRRPFYSRHGDWFALAASFVALAGMIISMKRGDR